MIKKLVLALMLLVTPVAAHEQGWYPNWCCGGHDCAVATVTFVASDPASLPSMVVSTHDDNGDHLAIVPQGFKVQESKDGNWHACFVFNQLYCLFGPPNS